MSKTINTLIDESVSTTNTQKKRLKEILSRRIESTFYENFFDMMRGSFAWCDTMEGHNYWEDVYDREAKVLNSLYEHSAE